MCGGQLNIEHILSRYPAKPESLISVLQDIQLELRYLPLPALKEAAQRLGVPLSRVFAVSTFYKAFSLIPKGEKIIRVCLGTACHVRGAQLVLDEIKRQLEIEPGETTGDMKFSLEVVNCVGACAMAPVVSVNDAYHGNVKTSAIKSLLRAKR